MKTFKGAFKYPVIILFFAFIAVVALADTLQADKEMSELENRKLTQRPAFSLKTLWENEWTYNYGEYIRDQFIARDGWVSFQSALELAQGKLEGGGIWYAKDDYLIPKNSTQPAAGLYEANIESVGLLAQRHPGKVGVMVVPSPANTLSDKLRASPPQIDENGMIDEMYTAFEAAGATAFDLRSAFTAAEAEGRQVYYHTDHHWTTDGGAFMAYAQYCEAMGREAVTPDEALRVEVPNFLGTSFAKSKKFGTQPEPLVYYDFPYPMTIQKAGGEVIAENTGIMNKEKLAVYDKYGAFLHGNNGYSVIEGAGEGSILIIKDSYGNSLAPYFAQSYAKVGIIDLRDWPSGLDAVIEEGGYEEILVLYSFDSFTTDTFIIGMAR